MIRVTDPDSAQTRRECGPTDSLSHGIAPACASPSRAGGTAGSGRLSHSGYPTGRDGAATRGEFFALGGNAQRVHKLPYSEQFQQLELQHSEFEYSEHSEQQRFE